MRKDALKRYLVYRLKLVELIHLSILWTALNDEQFVPDNMMGQSGRDFAQSIRTVMLSWFCTIVDQTSDGLSVVRVWRELFPRHRKRIDRLWKEIEPHWVVLRTFRDKCGFHADTPRNYFSARQEVIDNPQVARALQDFLELSTFLLRREEQELSDFVPEVEQFFLDFELESTSRFNRDALKRLLILPRGSYRRVFG
jgi:hypothetical protein